MTAPEFIAETLYEAESFTGLAQDVDAQGCRFLDCELTSLAATGGSFERTSWRGSTLGAVRFVAVGMARSNWFDVRLEGCALSGVELFGADLRRLHLQGCLLDTVNLRGSMIREVVFEDCTLRDVDLGAAKLTDVRLPGSRIERLDLHQATLSGVDLRGAQVHVSRGIERLRGAVVDPVQLLDLAPALAAHLGLEVRAAGEG